MWVGGGWGWGYRDVGVWVCFRAVMLLPVKNLPKMILSNISLMVYGTVRSFLVTFHPSPLGKVPGETAHVFKAYLKKSAHSSGTRDLLDQRHEKETNKLYA